MDCFASLAMTVLDLALQPLQGASSRRRAGGKRRPAAIRAGLDLKENGMSEALARKKFSEFRERTGAIDDAELEAFRESLTRI